MEDGDWKSAMIRTPDSFDVTPTAEGRLRDAGRAIGRQICVTSLPAKAYPLHLKH